MGSLNFGYLCTKAGILKLITVVLGFLASGPLMYAYNNAEYLEKDYIENEEWCLNGYEAKEKLKVPKDKLHPCPRDWMVLVPVIATFLCFVLGAIFLIILLFVELNKNGTFNNLDFFGHLLTGVLQLICAILVIVFISFAFNHVDCGRFKEENVNDFCVKRRNDHFEIHYFISGAAFTFLNAIAYFITAPMIKQSQ